MPIGVTPHSLPPASIAMASPRRIISDASPMALALVAQAETVAKLGPRAPVCIATIARGDVGDEHGDEERADAVRSLLEEHAELLMAGVQAADARADDDARRHPDSPR